MRVVVGVGVSVVLAVGRCDEVAVCVREPVAVSDGVDDRVPDAVGACVGLLEPVGERVGSALAVPEFVCVCEGDSVDVPVGDSVAITSVLIRLLE